MPWPLAPSTRTLFQLPSGPSSSFPIFAVVKMKPFFLFSALAVAASAALASIVDRPPLSYAPVPAHMYVAPKKANATTLLDFVKSRSDLSTLASVLQEAAGFREAFDTPASWSFTFFAPSNAAFNNTGAYFATYAATPKGRWWLGNLVQHHYVPNSQLKSSLFNSTYTRIQTGLYLYVGTQVVGGGQLMLNNVSAVVEADLPVSNGVVHIIDHILDPAAQLFEPDVPKSSQAFIAGSCANPALPNFQNWMQVVMVNGEAARASFVHPGILFTQSQIDIFREHALSGKEPWATTYANLQANGMASASYAVLGGGEWIGRGSDNATVQAWENAWQKDCYAAFLNAVMYGITRDDGHARTVAAIVDAWSSTLKGTANGDNLAIALSGRQYVNAAELVRYVRGSWPSGEAIYARAQAMVAAALVPNKDPIANPPSQPVVGGNQAALSHVAGMEFAIFTNNVTGFAAELEILLLPKTACVGYQGSGLQALIQNQTGQCAEAGRDQGHSADEVGWLEEGAQVAASQGNTSLFDLKSRDGKGTPLLMLGLEYYFKYNTGNSVPFDTTFAPCCCGNLDYAQISNASRGTAYPIGEIGYHYYAQSKGLSMPYTTAWLQKNRPLQTSSNLQDFPGWPTLTWASGSL
ncbi:hypothetical protein VTK73DRAFT_7801 [Phialemonium thermophilum]|uniref:FAS1 domain-containing protein n=1 Tax=Phialemonium thermophilum TaxID=223376 RepID=A0ABR3WD80_9PEZI